MGKTTEKHASKGFVLPLVLIFMTVFSVFSITFTQVLINTNRNIREQVDFTKAYYIARSGADIGRQLVASGETSWATFTGSLDSGAFHVSLEENNLIVSDATFNGVAAQARIGFVPGAGAPNIALYAAQTLDMGGGATIHGDVGIAEGSNISGSNNTTINGNLYYETGEIDTGELSSAVVQGQIINEPVSPPTIPEFPQLPSNLTDRGNLSLTKNDGQIIIDGSYSKIEVANKMTLSIYTGLEGNVLEIEVDEFLVDNGASVVISGAGALRLTVKKTCTIGGGNFTAEHPELFSLRFLNEDSTEFSFTANSSDDGGFPGSIFLDQGTMKLNGGQINGSVICGDNVSEVSLNGVFTGINLYVSEATVKIGADITGTVYGKNLDLIGNVEISSPNDGGFWGGGTGSGKSLFVWLR